MGLKRTIHFFLCAALVFSCLSCGKTDENVSAEQVIHNLQTFAKLYGYVKYFHPSDEAAELD